MSTRTICAKNSRADVEGRGPDRRGETKPWPGTRQVSRQVKSADSRIFDCNGAEPETSGVPILLLADCLVVMQIEKIESVTGLIFPQPDFFNRPQGFPQRGFMWFS